MALCRRLRWPALVSAALLVGQVAAAQSPAPAVVPAPAPLRLVVNVPARRLDVFEHGERTAQYPVAVGQPHYQTPVGSFHLSHAVWNPTWTPPPASDWAKDRLPMTPSARNPMGRVKLWFTELYYLHGTPETRSLGRAASHGCIRLANRDILALAALVQQYAGAGLDSAALARLAAHPSRTRWVTLATPIPLDLVYEPVEVTGDSLVVYPDIYARYPRGLVSVARRALVHSGAAAEDIDGAALTTTIRQAAQRGRRTAIALDDLLYAPADSSATAQRP